MKHLAIRAFAVTATVFFWCGCASDETVVTESPSTQTAAPVPGEKLPDEPTVVPGAFGSPNAGMRW